jgi:hypothetical protein
MLSTKFNAFKKKQKKKNYFPFLFAQIFPRATFELEFMSILELSSNTKASIKSQNLFVKFKFSVFVSAKSLSKLPWPLLLVVQIIFLPFMTFIIFYLIHIYRNLVSFFGCFVCKRSYCFIKYLLGILRMLFFF